MVYQFPTWMINPGTIAAAHQKEASQCSSCHKPFWGIPNSKCISCHKPASIGMDSLLKDSSQALLRFHEKLGDTRCTNCHTEHVGIDGDITVKNFDHSAVSDAVIVDCEGCHVKPSDNLHLQLSVGCNNCHVTDRWKPVTHFDHNKLSNTLLGNCSSCHNKPTDGYHATLTDNCSKCHSTSKWVPSTFDHSQYFLLDGDHNVKCNTCHTTNNYTVYTCYNCHEHSESKIREKHIEEGIVNFTNCARCHKTADEHGEDSEHHDRKDEHDDDD